MICIQVNVHFAHLVFVLFDVLHIKDFKYIRLRADGTPFINRIAQQLQKYISAMMALHISFI